MCDQPASGSLERLPRALAMSACHDAVASLDACRKEPERALHSLNTRKTPSNTTVERPVSIEAHQN
jgi:hypothetical protein